jgi:hypothetical protein
MARKSKQQQSIEALQLKALEAQVKILETASTFYDGVVDPLDALRDDDTGELWNAVGPASLSDERTGMIRTEAELSAVRRMCRRLAVENPFAICGHENRISYIVGTGHTYTIAAKKDVEIPEERIAEVQTIIDDFMEANRWHRRQQEKVLRKDRDGECFYRFFFATDGAVKIRFVEPVQVSQPAANPQDTFGIRTDGDDVETVLGYWIDGELIDASEVQHSKANVDGNVKRGLPLFYPVRKNLQRADKLLRNMTVVAEIQTAIALIRKHKQGTVGGLGSWQQAQATAQTVNSATGETRYHKHYAPGTILDVLGDMEYDFPAAGIDGSRYVQILQAELRAIASRVCMPEFMLSSDASNANYSSTMVAEGPAVKIFERLQFALIEEDLEVMNLVLDKAVESGKLDAALRADIDIEAVPPKLASRDRLKEAQADSLLVDKKIMSVRTAQLKNDLDPDTEEAQIEKESEESLARNPFAGLGGFGNSNGGNLNQGDNKNDDGTGNQQDGQAAAGG